MTKEYKVQIQIYGNTLHVYVGENIEDIVKYVENKYKIEFEEGTDTMDALTANLVNKKKKRTDHVMLLPKNTNGSILAHECVHSAYSILDYHFVKITPDNDEALAYLVGYLYREIINILDKHGKTKSKSNK